MSRFTLQSETIEIRGQTLTVRELTDKQKGQWAKAVSDDVYCAPSMLVSLVCYPPVTIEEAADWPSQITAQVVTIAQRLSGMGGDEKNA